MKNALKNQKWIVVSDDSGTYEVFDNYEKASKHSEQFCPMGEDGEGDMNVLILPETHNLISIMGWTERKPK
jgi:hypothetical protein